MDQVKIGAFLKTLRKENNLSQEQLADKFFVTVRTISRWENGNTLPDISVLIELADFYNIDIRDLLRGERKSDKMEENLKRVGDDVAWLIEKFDYRNKDADWKNSKDAIQRGMQKLRGGYPADPVYQQNK